MNYCPECGTRLELRWIAADGRERRVCAACDAIRYENPRILVAMMVTCGDRLLLCRRAQQPAIGTWTAPSGFMEQGETLEQAAARETFEESGVRVPTDDLVLYTITNLPRISEVYVCFRATVSSDQCRPGSESLDAAFFAEDDIPWDQLAYPEMSGYLRLFFREHAEQEFGIHLSRVDQQGRFRREYRLVPKT